MEEIDLVSEIFSEMDKWGGVPSVDTFAEKMIMKLPDLSPADIKNATATATQLQMLVRKSNAFYSEPYATIHEKISNYLRENLPGLSEHAYFLAKNRIMYMYIK
ncbi:hypothetical protein [Methylomonas albis]|uniref:Uncharacterized protein n=1 Tax=Methylomonas albis TaxID=1854563 RepID=A0ABR9CXY4_9GAMM|nr:hypothetical protein [Methylomonas albis]MBD9355698.1 hypothetical protein [Methylomonas albis]CAD6878712.1 hypothetical protein [Methylomonas albis]